MKTLTHSPDFFLYVYISYEPEIQVSNDNDDVFVKQMM